MANNELFDFTGTDTTVTGSADSLAINVDNELFDKQRKITESSLNTVDTINDIGSLMSDRIRDNVKKSLNKMSFSPNDSSNGDSTYTPIAYPTLQLAKELGIEAEFGDSVLNLYESEEIPSKNGESKKFNQRNNSMGDAWVVNPPFQFNPNDDVRSNLSFPYFGRVFNEKINSNYPIVTFEVGTIKYNTTMLSNTGFVGNDSDSGLTKRIRGGGEIGVGDVIGFPVAMVGTVLRTSWKILTLPAAAVLGLSKFARFSVDTALFASYFNDMAQSIATLLGLLTPLDIASSETIDFTKEDGRDTVSNIEKATGGTGKKPTDVSIEGSYAGARRRLIFESVVPGKGWGSAESDFIPFLADKDVTLSESVSNSTQSNPLAANLNSAAAEAAAAEINNYATGNDKTSADSFLNQLKSKVAHVKGQFFRGDVATVVKGEGRVTLPDMWSDSSFSRSVSLNFTFTSPYGHRLAIFENTYIPFILLFCMTMPRQIGSKTFTNPFFVRVNMKGRFSIPMGIIESFTVERGEDKNNWTSNDVPRTIKCSISIKDLSPVLMMSMSRSKVFSIFQSNDGLTSYINTLGGLSIHDQRDLLTKVSNWYKKLTERQVSNRGVDSTISDVLIDTFNPWSYADPVVRSVRSSPPGRLAVKLSQAGINPFTDKRERNINY